jgi:hypothetical protein
MLSLPMLKKISPHAFFATLALLCVSSQSFADLEHCDGYFNNGIQAHGPQSYIRFDYNAQLINPGSLGYLLGNTVESNKWSIKKSCGEKECIKLGSIARDMTPGPLVETSSTNHVVIPTNTKVTVGTDNVLEYGKIVISERAVATFKQQIAPYVISQLEVGYKSKLRLPAGEYWVSRLKLEVEGKIDVIGEGQVTLYVIDSLWVPFNFKINENTKDSAKMAIYTFSDSNFYTGSKTYGFVRSEGEIILNHRATIVGGILGQFINLQTESQVVYDPYGVRGVSFKGYCEAYDYPLDPDQPVFVLDQYEDYVTEDHIILTGTLVDAGSGIRESSINISGAWVPFTLTDGSFTINAPLELGTNWFTFLIYDNAGNELHLSYSVTRFLPGELPQ